MGDPAGIGPETVLKAFHVLSRPVRNGLTVFGNVKYFEWLDRRLKTGVKIIAPGSKGDGLRVEDAVRFDFSPRDFGLHDKRFGEASITSVRLATEAVLKHEYDALITPPINKESVNMAGHKVPGHTEYLAALCGGVPVAMMLACPELAVVVATTHVALREVPFKLTPEKIAALLRLINGSIHKLTRKKPRIAVCGLNPHASDGGIFGDEEARIIAPAIGSARREGIKVSGPFPADTMFTRKARRNYDVALAMYHDQGLIPVKTLGFGRTVNITLGLPFLRVSVDHGTAFDIAGKGRADAAPMAYAINTAIGALRGRF